MQVQYDIDMRSPLAELFLKVRAVLLEYDEIWEVKKQNITSYFCKEGGICYLRTKEDQLIIGLFQGICLEELYDLAAEKTKQIRHINYKRLDDLDIPYLQAIIKNSMICAMQKKERNQLKRSLQKKREKNNDKIF